MPSSKSSLVFANLVLHNTTTKYQLQAITGQRKTIRDQRQACNGWLKLRMQVSEGYPESASARLGVVLPFLRFFLVGTVPPVGVLLAGDFVTLTVTHDQTNEYDTGQRV